MEVGFWSDEARVADVRLDNDRRDAVGMFAKQIRDCTVVVERRGESETGELGRDAGAVGETKRRDARSGFHQKAVCVTVVTAFELDDELPTGRRARQAHRGHRRLGAAVYKPHHLEAGHAPPHRFGRSEEHTSELQSRELISYAVFCL